MATILSGPQYVKTFLPCPQIEKQTRSNQFEEEIRQEQEERRQEEVLKKERREAFKQKANMFDSNNNWVEMQISGARWSPCKTP